MEAWFSQKQLITPRFRVTKVSATSEQFLQVYFILISVDLARCRLNPERDGIVNSLLLYTRSDITNLFVVISIFLTLAKPLDKFDNNFLITA